MLSKYAVIRVPSTGCDAGAVDGASANALLTLPLLWLLILIAASAKAFKSIVGVRPSFPSFTLTVTGSSPGTVNVMSVLRPSFPRAVVTLGVAPLSPFSPFAPSAITTSFNFLSEASNSLFPFSS